MSKIANKIAQEIFKHGSYRLHESNHSPTIWLEDAIDQALEGKIINKSEVDALRKDAENMQSAQDAYNYTESLNSDLRRENAKLKQENTNLKIDNISMKAHSPIYWLKDTNWSEYNVKFTTTPAPNSEPVAEVIPWWKFWTPNW